MTIPQISQVLDELPTAPDPAVHGRALFATVAAASVLAQKEMIPQLNTFRAEANAMAAAMNETAEEIGDAAIVAAAAVALVNTTKWISGTTYAEGVTVWSPLDSQTYRRKVGMGGAGTTDPSLDAANWARVGSSSMTKVTSSVSVSLAAGVRSLVVMTPTKHGETVTLQDGTTMTVGESVNVIDNTQSDYFVRIANKAGALLGFAPPRTRCDIGLTDNSVLAGKWPISGAIPIGIASELAHTSVGNLNHSETVVDMGGDIEVLWFGRTADGYPLAVARRRSTNEYGTPAVIRAANAGSAIYGIKHTATQALFVSLVSGTAMEAVTLTLNPTTLGLTPNTAGTATIAASATMKSGCQILSIPSLPNSFVTAYSRSGVQAFRVIAITGTSATIGSEVALDGADGGHILTSADKVIAFSWTNATNNAFTKPYTISGSSASAGTGTSDTSVNSSASIQRMFPLGSRWVVIYISNGHNAIKVGIISLSGTTTTFSNTTLFGSTTSSVSCAITATDKFVVIAGGLSASDMAIVTDSAGTPSVGTKSSTPFGNAQAKYIVRANGTSILVKDGNNAAADGGSMYWVDCSGASPVVGRMLFSTLLGSQWGAFHTHSEDVKLRKSIYLMEGDDLSYSIPASSSYAMKNFAVGDTGTIRELPFVPTARQTTCRGINDRERWWCHEGTLQLLECAA